MLVLLSALVLFWATRGDTAFWSVIGFLALGTAYFFLLSFGVWHWASSLSPNAPPWVAVFSGLFVLYVVIPAQSFPHERGIAAALVAWGLERCLAAYSYCRETMQRRDTVPAGIALFFLSVSPEVVFRSRDAACRPDAIRGGGRALWGAMLLLVVVILEPHTLSTAPALSVTNLEHGLLYGAEAFALLYAAHSGLAHIQIGLCRIAGYRAPERYRYPLAAASPREFWQRWNIYLGGWVQLYVFNPLVRRQQKLRSLRHRAALGTLGAFAWLGVMHQVYWYVVGRTVGPWVTIGFILLGVQVVLWSAFQRRADSHISNDKVLYRALSQVALAPFVAMATWLIR